MQYEYDWRKNCEGKKKKMEIPFAIVYAMLVFL